MQIVLGFCSNKIPFKKKNKGTLLLNIMKTEKKQLKTSGLIYLKELIISLKFL